MPPVPPPPPQSHAGCMQHACGHSLCSGMLQATEAITGSDPLALSIDDSGSGTGLQATVTCGRMKKWARSPGGQSDRQRAAEILCCVDAFRVVVAAAGCAGSVDVESLASGCHTEALPRVAPDDAAASGGVVALREAGGGPLTKGALARAVFVVRRSSRNSDGAVGGSSGEGGITGFPAVVSRAWTRDALAALEEVPFAGPGGLRTLAFREEEAERGAGSTTVSAAPRLGCGVSLCAYPEPASRAGAGSEGADGGVASAVSVAGPDQAAFLFLVDVAAYAAQGAGCAAAAAADDDDDAAAARVAALRGHLAECATKLGGGGGGGGGDGGRTEAGGADGEALLHAAEIGRSVFSVYAAGSPEFRLSCEAVLGCSDDAGVTEEAVVARLVEKMRQQQQQRGGGGGADAAASAASVVLPTRKRAARTTAGDDSGNGGARRARRDSQRQ